MLPFYPGDHLYGQGKHIGLCTLWTPRTKYTAQLPYVYVIGNLYSRFGVGLMIRNVLATPAIQHIVVTGVDNPEVNQRQADSLLSGDLDGRTLLLEPEHLAEFYRRVTFYDARDIPLRQQTALTQLLLTLPVGQSNHLEPIVLPIPEVSRAVYPTARSGHLFRYDTIADAHRTLIQEIRTFGEYTQPDSEGHFRQELWQVEVCLSPKSTATNVPFYSDEEIVRYGEALWNGDEPAELTYRYGHTMRHRYGDQIAAAIEAFRKKPETFRTVISLWEPLKSMLRDDEPCLTIVQPRIRNGVLDLFAYIRTNDMFKGWPENAGGLRYFQQKSAEVLSATVFPVTIGELTIQSGSAHIYDHQWPQVEEYLARPRPRKIKFDPKGDWRFTFEDDQFVAEHYHQGQLVQIIRADTIDQLEKKILPFISEVSHALFLGRQLAGLQYGR